MDSAQRTNQDYFEELLVQLRTEGHTQAAEQLDSVLHHTAYTTGSELLGEVGRALRAFERTRPALSRPLRHLLRTCQRLARPA